jgi:putative hemolysin
MMCTRTLKRVLFLVWLAGCTKPTPPSAQDAAAPRAQLANPASVHCTDVGGALVLEGRPDGAQFGVCGFADNRQCEEWALLRGQCPMGGVRVAGYRTAAARYCAISGGHYSITANGGSADETGGCTLPSGQSCDAEAYYRGSCTPR